MDLPQNMTTGDGFSLIFMNTKSGNVYYKVRGIISPFLHGY